jgi:hypothetical protein
MHIEDVHDCIACQLDIGAQAASALAADACDVVVPRVEERKAAQHSVPEYASLYCPVVAEAVLHV